MADTRTVTAALAGVACGYLLARLVAKRLPKKTSGRAADVRPSQSWPEKFGFQLTEGARETQFTRVGPNAVRLAENAKNDLDRIESAKAGFVHMIENFDTLESEGFQVLDCTHHPLQPDIDLEEIKYLERDNGDGTKDICYISLHVCELDWPNMMDVYHDERLLRDTIARGYDAKVTYESGNSTHARIYHTLLKDEKIGYGVKDVLQYCDKFPHKNGEAAIQASIYSHAVPLHPFVYRDTTTHFAGSAMFNHPKKGLSKIYCVRDQRIMEEDDIYDNLIKGMSLATEQQIVYGREHGTAFPYQRATNKYDSA